MRRTRRSTLIRLVEEDGDVAGVGRQKQLFPMLSRIAQPVHAPSTARLHHRHRPDVARPGNLRRSAAAPGSNDFRYRYHHFRYRYHHFRYRYHVTARAEAVQRHGDALAGTRPEHGRAGRAERALRTGSRRRTARLRSRRQTGSSATFAVAARKPDVDDRSRVVQRHGRVAATSGENC